MKFAIRVSSLGGIFVEQDCGREWGEYILRVEAPDEEAVYRTTEYREAQDLSERIRGEEDEPLPPTLEDVKTSFAQHQGSRLGAQYRWATGRELGAWRREEIPDYDAPVNLQNLHVEVWNRHNNIPVGVYRPTVEGCKITGWVETWPGGKS